MKTVRPDRSPSLAHILSSPGLEQRQLQPEDIPRSQLVEAVRGYLAAIPHHAKPHEQLQCDVGKAWEFHFYRVTVSLLVETRTVARQRVPYRGWKVPAKTKDESNTDAWSYSMPRKTLDDKLEPKTSIVTDSQSVHDCSRCSVTGWLDCDRCTAKGKITCGGCGGQGRITCTACRGAGKLTKSRVVERQEKCKNCGLNTAMNILAVLDDNPYSHARRCRTCGGTGVRRWRENEQYQVDCNRCHTMGQEPCRTCRTTGLVTCSGCTGKGKVGCSDCEKCKRVVSYLSVTQEHKTLDAGEIAVPGPLTELLKHEDPRLFPTGATELMYEETAETLPLEPYRALTEVQNVAGQISRKCCDLVERVRSRKLQQARVVQERVALFRGRCVGFLYSTQGAGYKAVSRPIDLENARVQGLVSHISPATRWLCKQMRESQSLAESGDVREAALLLGRCKEVAATDRVCSEYLRDGIAKLPEKVLEMSDRVTLTFSQILFFSSAAAILIVGFSLALIWDIAFPAITAAVAALFFLILGVVFGRSQADLASNRGVLSSAVGLFRRRQ